MYKNKRNKRRFLHVFFYLANCLLQGNKYKRIVGYFLSPPVPSVVPLWIQLLVKIENNQNNKRFNLSWPWAPYNLKVMVELKHLLVHFLNYFTFKCLKVWGNFSCFTLHSFLFCSSSSACSLLCSSTRESI